MDRWNKSKLFAQPDEYLPRRAASAGIWMLVLQALGYSLKTVRIIVLARLLTPEAFGLVGIALLVIELVRVLTQTGFGLALVQRKGDIKDYLDTFWILSVIRGLVLGSLVFSTASLAANFFNAPDAKYIIQAIAAVLVIQGLNNSGMIYFFKELQVNKRFFWEMSRIVTDLTVAIFAALVLRNAWALVYGLIASNVVGVIVSYTLHPYRPHLKFDFQKAKDLFGFGKWVLLTTIANYIFTRLDSIFVGRFLGVFSLGLYEVAHRIGDMVARQVGNITNFISFPVYSKLQDDPSMLREAFLVGIKMMALVTFPIAVFIFLLAPEITTLILGEQWIASVPAMRILGIAGAVFSLLGIGGSLLYAVNKPHLRFVMMVVSGFVMFLLLISLIRELSLTRAAIVMLSGNVCGLLFLAWISNRILNVSVKDLARLLVSPFIVSSLLSITMILAKKAAGQVDLGEFILILCAASIVYVAFSLVHWRFFKSGPIQILALMRNRN